MLADVADVLTALSRRSATSTFAVEASDLVALAAYLAPSGHVEVAVDVLREWAHDDLILLSTAWREAARNRGHRGLDHDAVALLWRACGDARRRGTEGR